MRELNIHFTIYTKDMQTKSVKILYILLIRFVSSVILLVLSQASLVEKGGSHAPPPKVKF